jgi:hypothetical protein
MIEEKGEKSGLGYFVAPTSFSASQVAHTVPGQKILNGM